MPVRRVKSFSYREFDVQLAEIGPGAFRAVAYEVGGTDQVDQADGSTIDDVETEIKQRLNRRSASYVGTDGAINLFLRAFPEGFQDPFYREWERDYKDRASAFVAEHLSEQRLDEAIDGGRYGDVCHWSRQAYSRTNLISPFESARITEFHRQEANQKPFARAVRALLYGGGFAEGLRDVVEVLKPKGAATWPVVTYLPFFRFPERHMFLKPEVTRHCADRIGFDLDYESRPNIETYQSLLNMIARIREGISALEPRDNIDIQSMIWALGSKGYVAEAEQERKSRQET